MFDHEHDVFIEITESAPLGNDSWQVGSLEEVRGKGVKMAVDDFGAGYSNLLYLAALSPEIVKLDRNLVSGLQNDARKQSIVRTMVRLCHELGARVIAEGIETTGELDAVVACGVDFGQGYLIGRPHEWESGQFGPPVSKSSSSSNGCSSTRRATRQSDAACAPSMIR
jgi:EAL domain-containing protein (putative c-di-GMP-specific phosphodiesterase class I)